MLLSTMPAKRRPVQDVDKLYIRQKLIDSAQERFEDSVDEFAKVFALLKTFDKTVTVFGSARLGEETWAYKTAYDIGARMAHEGYAVVTGGGPGIMEAANKGAYDAGGDSVGLNILLSTEQQPNPYTTAGYEFKHFFSRKVSMTLYESAFIYLPGGFGTLDELTEILTLKQTGKIDGTPIILVGELFWRPFDTLFREVLLTNQTIEEADMNLYHIVNDVDEITRIVNEHQQTSITPELAEE